MELYDLTASMFDGSSKNLSDYKGKVLLIVNTATGCGFTPQYAGLQELYEKYADTGLEILDFPCNQFGNQAPDSDEDIHSFCMGRFGTTFPQFAKINVNGESESLIYTWLKSQKGGLLSRNIKWNFTKFLVNRSGAVVGRYGPTEKPASLIDAIEALLKEEK